MTSRREASTSDAHRVCLYFARKIKKIQTLVSVFIACGDPTATRTRDNLIKSQVLYQLSYWAMLHQKGVVAGVAGFEPTHARVKVLCLTAWLHPYKGLTQKIVAQGGRGRRI